MVAEMTWTKLNTASAEARQDALMAARRRFRENRDTFIQANPNGVSNAERQAFDARRKQAGLEAHEMEMLKERNRGALAEAHERRLGEAERGMEAAKLTSAADLEAKKYEADAGVSRAEKEWAARKEIAAGDVAARRYEADARKSIASEENAGRERIGAASNASALEVERERTKQAEARSRVELQQEAAKVQQQREKALFESRLKTDAALQGKLVTEAGKLMRENPNLTPEEAKEKAKGLLLQGSAASGGLASFRAD